MSSVAVIGAGAWGTALAVQAARAGNEVVLWVRDPGIAAQIEQSRETPRLPGIRLPGAIRATADLPHHAELVLMVVPTQHMRAVAAQLPASLKAPIVICAKGVEQGTLRLPLEIFEQERQQAQALILSGPNFAREVAEGLPAASVVAGADPGSRADAIARLATPSFRLYGNDDAIGAQIGGAAKNVIAIAAGAVTGAGLGENARAAVVTRGLAELGRLVVALGGRQETVMGLSGLGDLLLTCTGAASRNFSLGLALGRGETLADILSRRQAVTEGVTTAPALIERARQADQAVDLPICQGVAAFLAGRASLAEAMAGLLSRPLRDE
jgi:glycerol-3-phosphate dehydrogenase (NAD(P)+)